MAASKWVTLNGNLRIRRVRHYIWTPGATAKDGYQETIQIEAHGDRITACTWFTIAQLEAMLKLIGGE